MARPNVMGNHKCSEAEKGCESARVACLKIDTCQCRFGPPGGQGADKHFLEGCMRLSIGDSTLTETWESVFRPALGYPYP